MKRVHVAAAVIRDASGKILIARRADTQHQGGLWEFPGGKVDAGESEPQALVRELEEELGIGVHQSCLAPAGFASHAYDEFQLVLLLFAIRKWQGVPRGMAGQGVRWVRPPELFGLDMPPADRPLLGLLNLLV